MSNRITAFLVTLEEPIHEDDAEITLAAIRQLRGVLDVQPVVGNALGEQAAVTRRDIAWQRAIGDAIRKGPRKDSDHE
jgi:hypothetical protein